MHMPRSEALERVIVMWKDSVPLHPEPTPLDWRREFESLCAKFPLPEDIETEEVDAGGVPALWVSAPGVSRQRTILHFHSGGYVMGSAKGYREFAYRLSRATDARVLVPDYRLAPDHPYPAPVEDALTVYRWLAAKEDPARIVTTGDSAGGGLNLAMLVALRDEGDTLPVAAVAISPLTDLAAEGESYESNRHRDPVVTKELAVGMGVVYLGEGRDPKDTPLGSPLYAEVHGLPPLLVLAGEAETLRDDSVRFVEKVRAAGGQAELEVADEMLHIYPLFASILPEGREGIERIGEFVRQHTPAPAPVA
jgi:monoterpene epsilon-lactone hydrolase